MSEPSSNEKESPQKSIPVVNPVKPDSPQQNPAEKAIPDKPPVQTNPTGAPLTNQKPAAKTPAVKQPETRERCIWFTQVDKEGTIIRTKVTRKIAVSNSPMLDSFNSLLAGPTAAEKQKGMISLIPSNTKILSATVRGNTAYISFNENFQYNTYGVEGYAAQLRQVVWTATEFPNIKDVQILIEGRRIDYLGEGIWIGSPVSRNSL
jgi:spore germination protein GerM